MVIVIKYFIDTEFIDDGKTIDLISIGIVCEDGREYYAQSVEFRPEKASEWVTENVIAHLDICPYGSEGYVKSLYQHAQGQCVDQRRGRLHRCPWRTRTQLLHGLNIFFNAHASVELWGWCAGYDFVALCQLFGTMMDLPAGYPHYIRDLQYLLDERGIADDELPQQEEAIHNALADARHIKRLWEYIPQSMMRKDEAIDVINAANRKWMGL